ncbi:peptidase family M49-domain-containing protein [Dipodascopsis tothii]|uniref:peptidase family M49-domain-containing protein n=1 Tax=Dipodascopsis tothii TaxID=44089 RepID=UPI0034CFD53C
MKAVWQSSQRVLSPYSTGLITQGAHKLATAALPPSFHRIASHIYSCPGVRLPVRNYSTQPDAAAAIKMPSTDFTAAQTRLFADTKAPFSSLTAKAHFDELTTEEKLYAHYFSKAGHWGTRVGLRQVSPESEQTFDLIMKLYAAVEGNWEAIVAKDLLSTDELELFLEYASQFLSNLGNYKSFGDVKFIPRLARARFEAVCSLTPETAALFAAVADALYSVEPPATTMLGYPENGHVTSYYAGAITKAEVEAIQAEFSKLGFMPENTRVFKKSASEFDLVVASGENKAGPVFDVPAISAKVSIVYGDHAREMTEIAKALDAAKAHAANETQKKMLAAYVDSFATGDMQAHKESQKYWVKDVGPNVETNIGFIETYRDPAGIRGEWECLVAMVNKERTKTFGELVDGAKGFIDMLPWPKEFEKDTFTPPDFTSLEVMTFAGSGIPAGINIPNYDDVRQTIGFKNVSLGNILSAKSANEKISFLSDEDAVLFDKLRGPSFEVQVGIHELLGHGSGKLLTETAAGVYNYDKENPPLSPIDGKPVTTHYKLGETWGGKFGMTAGSYEECRAECVAMYLCTDKPLLKIFGHGETGEQNADDVLYISYLQMARAGLLALEYWDPVSKKWGQPHMQARFSILKTFLEASAPGEAPFVTLTSTTPDHSDLLLTMDRTKILSHGRVAVGKYLQKLHIYKSSGDVENGLALYAQTTTVPEELAQYREAVLSKKLPRRQFVQCNTFVTDTAEGKTVQMKEYEPSARGLIQSFAEREY